MIQLDIYEREPELHYLSHFMVCDYLLVSLFCKDCKAEIVLKNKWNNFRFATLKALK